jgi:hypothetical protein
MSGFSERHVYHQVNCAQPVEGALTITLENLSGQSGLLDSGQGRLYQHERLRSPLVKLSGAASK